MRIGVDYDGVLSDPSSEKIYFARYYYGRQLRPEDCTTLKAAPILDPNGREKYVAMYKILESGPATLRCKVVQDSVRVLDYLIRMGHKIIIITTLDKENYPWAKAFLHQNKVPYHHFVCVPINKHNPEQKKHTKSYILKKLKIDVMIDDSYSNLEPLSGSGVHLFLLDRPWNRHEKITCSDITRVSWYNLYQEVSSPNAKWKFVPKTGLKSA